jgi:hypothetical protein
MLKEEWAPVPEFPAYLVSNHGRVINADTDRFKTPSANQQGIPSVNFIKDGLQFRRSVALLVAQVFLPPIPNRPDFDCPINMDGDRFNNRVDNLAWRPRHFAVKYHRQFNEPTPFGFNAPVSVVGTGEVFETVRQAAKWFGLLEKEIIMSINNHVPVFPTWDRFELVPQ